MGRIRHLNRFLTVASRLVNANAIRYVVIGGYAVAYHGYVRYTGDLDLFVDRRRSMPGDVTVNSIALPLLLRNKRASGRQKDPADVEAQTQSRRQGSG